VVFTVDMPWAWLLSSFSPATAGLTPKSTGEVNSVKLAALILPTLNIIKPFFSYRTIIKGDCHKSTDFILRTGDKCLYSEKICLIDH